MKGRISNESSRAIWVVETDSGRARAHLLEANRRSPDEVDADGFKTTDGSPVGSHTSWIKVNDLGSITVRDGAGGGLTYSCTWFTCSEVGETEFGTVTYDDTPGWGV